MTRRRDYFLQTNLGDEAKRTGNDAAARWLADHEPPKWRKRTRETAVKAPVTVNADSERDDLKRGP